MAEVVNQRNIHNIGNPPACFHVRYHHKIPAVAPVRFFVVAVECSENRFCHENGLDTCSPQFENYLRVRFIGLEKSTTVEFQEEATQSYRCEELAVNGMGKGCVNLTARRSSEATMKCALIAHDRGWLGGVASPGRCK